MEEENLNDKINFDEEIVAILTNLKVLHNSILERKLLNFASIANSKSREETLYLYYIRDCYNELMISLEEGIRSANLVIEFIKLTNYLSGQKSSLDKENLLLRKNVSDSGSMFIAVYQRYKKMSCFFEVKESELEHLGFALYILDEFYFNKEKIENSIWNIATNNSMDNTHLVLPTELLQIKWLCNHQIDDLPCIEVASTDCQAFQRNDKTSINNLCYLAKNFYDCFNFKCSNFFIDKIMSMMKENRLNNQVKYYFHSICKGLLLGRLHHYNQGYKILMESIDFLRSNTTKILEHDVLIGCEMMCVGCLLVNWGVSSNGIQLLKYAVIIFEEYLPQSYDNWEEASILSARFNNDINEFKDALMVAAPCFDYFHIFNFGSIKDTNKPVYELAIEMSIGAKVRSVTKNMKYPLYLPRQIEILLSEMIISFSGLGDRSSASIIENWTNRCKLLSSNYQHMVIEKFEYSWLPNIEKVIFKMQRNIPYHEKIFSGGTIVKRD